MTLTRLQEINSTLGLGLASFPTEEALRADFTEQDLDLLSLLILSGASGGGGSGTGDVVGPASSTDNAIVRFDSTTGKLLQNSTVTVSDTGSITLPLTTGATVGVINKAGSSFIHDYSEVGSQGKNTFVGVTAGNFTMATGGGADYLGSLNTAVGFLALRSNTTGYGNSAVGYNNLTANTTGYQNSADGTEALHANTTGFQNTAMGCDALFLNTTGYTNTATGFSALYSNTTGFQNTAAGVLALFANTEGTENTATGFQALQDNTTGDLNSAHGWGANKDNTIGNYNSAFGANALLANTSGTGNTANGYLSLQANLTSNYNCALGYGAGYGATGARNVLLGPSTVGASLNQVTTGSNNIAIGNDVAVATATASDQLCIGNLIYGTGLDGTGATISSGNIGIGTKVPTSKLHVVGLVEYADNAAALAGGLTVGAFYRTADILKVVH